MLLGIGIESPLPFGLELGAALDAAAEVPQRLIGDVELLVGVPAVCLLREANLLLTKGGAVGGRSVLLMGAAEADVRADHDQRWALCLAHGGARRRLKPLQRHVLPDVLDVPPIRLVAHRHVL
jgi:hypothetical protein